MNMISERLIYKLKNELDFILDSCAAVRKDDDKAREKMVKCILHKKGGAREDISSVKDSVAYKLADILKSEPKSWGEFKEMVKTFIPTYSANPRALTTYGGFNWKMKFEVPPKQTYRSNRASRKKKAEEIPVTVIKNFNDEMIEFGKSLLEYKSLIDDLTYRLEKIESILQNTPVISLRPLL